MTFLRMYCNNFPIVLNMHYSFSNSEETLTHFNQIWIICIHIIFMSLLLLYYYHYFRKYKQNRQKHLQYKKNRQKYSCHYYYYITIIILESKNNVGANRCRRCILPCLPDTPQKIHNKSKVYFQKKFGGNRLHPCILYHTPISFHSIP